MMFILGEMRILFKDFEYSQVWRKSLVTTEDSVLSLSVCTKASARPAGVNLICIVSASRMFKPSH